ncbi:MAG TPA: lytic transglycosylase domain-containing protein, partial [Nocardioidaceae bacterium]|nr:lytic transglycosylase domain-containing protein [Nocardioidaceae bacterium]
MQLRRPSRAKVNGYAIPLLAALPLILSSGSVSGVSSAAGQDPIDVRILETQTGSLVAAQPGTPTPTGTAGLSLPGEAGQPPTVVVTSPKGERMVTESGPGAHDIPATAVQAYQRAAAILAEVDPSCRMPWTLLAAIGRVESDHGRYGGAILGVDGVSSPLIFGLPLNGVGPVAEIADTDGGRLDDDTVWDRAVGPMQFIPSTWAIAGVDADGDDVRSPHDIHDAALAAAVYLCADSTDIASPDGMSAAIHRYNHSDAYVALVMAYEQAYRTGDFTVTTPTTTSPGSADFEAVMLSPEVATQATQDATKATAAVKKHRKSTGTQVDMTGSPTDRPAVDAGTVPLAAPQPTAPVPSTQPGPPRPTPTETPVVEEPTPTHVPTAGPASTFPETPAAGPSSSPTATPPGTTPSSSPSTPPATGSDPSPSGTPSSGPTSGPTTGPTTGPTDGPTSGPTTGATQPSPSTGPDPAPGTTDPAPANPTVDPTPTPTQDPPATQDPPPSQTPDPPATQEPPAEPAPAP